MSGKAPTITMRRVDALVPYARNARTHSHAQVDQLARSIREFGWTTPVLIDGEGTIIAGHGRVLAAKQLGLTEVPCIELAHLSDEQRRAYVLADNKLALNAGWDDELLRIELTELRELEVAQLTGFTEAEQAVVLKGWEASSEPASVAPKDDPLQARIVVRCIQADAERVRKAVADAVAGIEGASVDA